MIASIRPTSVTQDSDLALTRAGYHAAAGEYSDARIIYQTLLRADPFDMTVHLTLGELYRGMSEYEKAKASFSKIPPTAREWLAARRGLGATLSMQRRFTEAIDLLDEVFRCAPWDAQTLAVFLRVLTDAGDCELALELGRGYLQGKPPAKTAEITARNALGRALLECGKILEAEQQFAAALAMSHQQSLLAMYGLMRGSIRGGEPCRFSPIPIVEQPFDELRVRMFMVEQFADDKDDTNALDFAMAALKLDPQNLAALIRVAEAHQHMARQTGDILPAVEASRAVLMSSPMNNLGLTA